MTRRLQAMALVPAAATALLLSATATAAEHQARLLPPDAKPGECYARVLQPAQYATETRQMVKREAAEQVRIIPAQYETVTERVLVREASTKLEIVPAVYETVTEQVMIKPATTKLVEVPPSYRTVTEQVLVSPAQTVWKTGGIASQSGGRILKTATSGETGEVLCLVEIPAEYKTVTRTVLDRPATTREVQVPAEYMTVTKRMLKTPPTTREVTIPAEYRTVQVTKLVQPARTEKIPVPAEYQSVSTQKLVKEPALEWRRVLCDENMTETNIYALQRELKDAGFYKGPIDGVLGPMTMGAVNDYARSHRLPTGNNYITLDVAKELGIRL